MGTLLILLFTAIVTVIFIKSFKDYWNECGSDLKEWFSNTRLSMCKINRDNKVKILSEKEFNKLTKNSTTIIIL